MSSGDFAHGDAIGAPPGSEGPPEIVRADPQEDLVRPQFLRCGSQRKNAITDAIARVAVMQVASNNQSAGVPPAFALVGWDSCTCTGSPSAAGVPLTIIR